MNKRIVSIISFMLTIMMTVNAIAAVPVSGENGQNTLYSAVSNSYGADAESVSVSDDSLSDNTISGDSLSDNTVSGDSISDNTISDNTVSGDLVSDNTISRNMVDAGDDLAAEQAAVFSLQTATTVMKDIGHTVAAVFTKSVKKPAQVKKADTEKSCKGKAADPLSEGNGGKRL